MKGLVILVAIGVVATVAFIYGIGGVLFTLAWNCAMPALWHAAPHLSFWQGIAAFWLLAIVQSVVSKVRGE